MINIIYSSDCAQELNNLVKINISPRLFVFNNYNSDWRNSFSYEGKYHKAVTNLYKLLIDCCYIIKDLNYIFKDAYSCKDDIEKIRDIANNISNVRSVMFHNNDRRDGLLSQIQIDFYDTWIRTNLDKKEPSCDEDYKVLLSVLEQYGDNIIQSFKNIIITTGKIRNKDNIIKKWSNIIYSQYGKKRDIFYNQLGMAMQQYCGEPSNAERLKRMERKSIKGILNKWIYYSYENVFIEEQEKIESIFEIVQNLNVDTTKIKELNKKLKDIDIRKKKFYDDVREKLHKPYECSLEPKDLAEFLFLDLENQLRQIADENPTCSIQPDDIMQRFIDKKFKNVKTPSIRPN